MFNLNIKPLKCVRVWLLIKSLWQVKCLIYNASLLDSLLDGIFLFFGIYFYGYIFLKIAQFFIPCQVLITLSSHGIYVYNFLTFAVGINLTLETTNNSFVFQRCPPTDDINIFFLQFMQFCLKNILHPSAPSSPWFNPLKMGTFNSICTGKCFPNKTFVRTHKRFIWVHLRA